jgi:TrmH family RNA methyltransferase
VPSTPALELANLSVVLVETRNPLNIGAAARALANFGVSSLRLVRPFAPSFREARSAVGAAAILAQAVEYQAVAESVADAGLVVGTTAARQRELQHDLVPLPRAAALIRRRLRSGDKVAVLFGSEKRGLSNQDFSHCHWLVRIPTRDQGPSMNLGQAVAVCLYEIARRPLPPVQSTRPQAPAAAELERIAAALVEVLRTSGYARSGSVAFAAKARRLVYRLGLSAADAQLLLGMLRQIAWKLGSKV